MSPTTHLLNSLTVSVGHQSTAPASVKWCGGDKHGALSITQAAATPDLAACLGREQADGEGEYHHRAGVMLQLASCSYW